MKPFSQLSEQQARRYLLILLTIHVVVWTLASSLSRPAVPADTLESIVWGMQWQWGYDKHPFVAPWLAAAATWLGGNVGWPVYLLGELNIVACFWAVWRLGREVLTPAQALVSVCLLEMIWYYGLLGPKFDPNSLMMSMWMLTTLAFYRALTRQTLRYWILAGVLGGLSLVCKYQSALLLLSFLAVMLATMPGRQAWRTAGPYCALISLLVIITPNLLWLSQHDFVAWQYALGRVESHQVAYQISNHWRQPWQFIQQQLGTLALFLMCLLGIAYYPRQARSSLSFAQRFLLIIGLGPLVISVAISASLGMYLYAKWAAPYFSLLGVIVLMHWRPQIDARHAKGWFSAATAVMLMIVIVRAVYLTYFPYLAKKHHVDAFYPYQPIATVLNQQWSQRYQTPLHFVAGTHYLIAGVSAYAPSHPQPYFDWDSQQSAWINEQQLRREGAMFAWEDNDPSWIKKLQKRYPHLQYLGVQRFPSLNSHQNLDYNIAIAVLPPAKG